jgi:hypothetical protein
VTLADAESFQRGFTLVDAATLADSSIFGRGIVVSDAATTADAVASVESSVRGFADLVGVADAVDLLQVTGGVASVDLLDLSAFVQIGTRGKVVL